MDFTKLTQSIRFGVPRHYSRMPDFPEKASLRVLFRPKLNVTLFKTGSIASRDNVTPRVFPFFAKAP